MTDTEYAIIRAMGRLLAQMESRPWAWLLHRRLWHDFRLALTVLERKHDLTQGRPLSHEERGLFTQQLADLDVRNAKHDAARAEARALIADLLRIHERIHNQTPSSEKSQ